MAGLVAARELTGKRLSTLVLDGAGHVGELVRRVTERVVMRHHPYTPPFGPGCVRRLATARQHLPAGRVDLAGDHMSAPWVDGAIRGESTAAHRVSDRLTNTVKEQPR